MSMISSANSIDSRGGSNLVEIPKAIRWEKPARFGSDMSSIRRVKVGPNIGTASPGSVVSFEIPNVDILMNTTLNFAFTDTTDTSHNNEHVIGGHCVIKSLTVSVGGEVVTQITDYNHLVALLRWSCMPDPYIKSDGAILEHFDHVNRVVGGAATTNTWYCSIPLYSGLLSTTAGIPTFLFSSPIHIEITVADAVHICGNATGTVSTVMSDMNLICEYMKPDADFIELMRRIASKDMLYLNTIEFFGSPATAGANSGYNYRLGTQCKSLLGVIYGTTAANVPFKFSSNYHTGTIFMIDSDQAPSFVIGSGSTTKVNATQNLALIKSESDRLFGSLFDLHATGSVAPTAYPASAALGGTIPAGLTLSAGAAGDATDSALASYISNGYVIGTSTTKVSEEDFAFRGTKLVTGVTIQHDVDTTNSAASTLHAFLIKEQLLIIDGMGNVTKSG